MLEEIGIDAAAGEDADRAAEGARIATRALECFPRAFEKQAMLWIRQLRFAGIHAEEVGIELVDFLENGPRLHEVGLPAHFVGETVLELSLAEVCDRLDAALQIPPELIHIAGAR